MKYIIDICNVCIISVMGLNDSEFDYLDHSHLHSLDPHVVKLGAKSSGLDLANNIQNIWDTFGLPYI